MNVLYTNSLVLRPPPFFLRFAFSLCIILNANRRTKSGGGLGTRLVHKFDGHIHDTYIHKSSPMSRNQLILYTIPFLLRFTNLYNEGHRRRQCQRKVVDRQIDSSCERGRISKNEMLCHCACATCNRFINDVIVVALPN